MAATTRFSQSQLRISNFFNNSKGKIWTYFELSSVCDAYRKIWNLPQSMQPRNFIGLLVEKVNLQVITMDFPSNHFARYVWGEKPNLFALSATIHEKAYFSHLSAAYLNGLISTKPKEIYINVEQKERPSNEMSLTQMGIDRAFKKKPRVTGNRAIIDKCAINLLNGKQTANLGVIKKDFEGIGAISLTDIERTLIDIAVRPVYSGGPINVLNAYRVARSQASTEKIATYLKTIDHKYPYHQCIGFYLEKAGYPENSLFVFDKMEKKFTFYLEYQMKNPTFSKRWNLFHPRDAE
jgi:predicted transcriptional regulator of viral defense system